MIYKTLSVKQPYATLICAGVKKVENRTWKTDYRGRLLIHASGDHNAYPDLDCLPNKFAEKVLEYTDKKDKPELVKAYDKLLNKAYIFYGQDVDKDEPPGKWLKEAVKKYGFFMSAQAIIGEVALVDIVDNRYSLDNEDTDFAERGCFFWKFADPIFYDKPIINVIGRLRLWNFEKDA